ncbi:hypothetical protein OVS_02810 [Mycoplasma ovis str. Michigan]|uniref:Uncharacterized protein n=1 Tax=Mycoplasma ovis str. Michigan TaxID=1415773 RepID=A0ABM5P1R8_9MOLU|nr:hypothetical protein [Mycoplasma ovis]AHC40360.1 hypothetical protein OVS_02810 [Mycoplasma ovis str. Michigan]
MNLLLKGSSLLLLGGGSCVLPFLNLPTAFHSSPYGTSQSSDASTQGLGDTIATPSKPLNTGSTDAGEVGTRGEATA